MTVPDYLGALDDEEEEVRAQIAREDVDAGMRLVVYLLFGAGFGLGVLLLAGAWALLLR